MSHNPNPFDFVPLPPKPMIYERSYLDRRGAPVSGYADVEIKALTPVHVVGALSRDKDATASHSAMYRQDGSPMIPAASIRGMLRAFLEALTGGWLSQVNETYPKEEKKRHIGFSLFEEYIDYRGRRTPPAVNVAFRPPQKDADRLDIPSYLFGIVTEPEDKNTTPLIRKGRIWIEDAIIRSEDIVSDVYWVPDIDSESAFMGGANPRASNWWYFKPAEVRKREAKLKHGGTAYTAEFIGHKLRGRKFYFHQDPVKATAFYQPDSHWEYPDGFRPIWLECMNPGAVTQTFRIYVDRVPMLLLILLELALTPGNIRHKLGYGKAYGYGSVEFQVKSWHLRTDKPGVIPAGLQQFQYNFKSWQDGRLDQLGVRSFIDERALTWLARIGGWEDEFPFIFTYPPFTGGNFRHAVKWRQFKRQVENRMRISDVMKVDSSEARQIAKALWHIKKPIHFRYYQERANGWEIIKARKP